MCSLTMHQVLDYCDRLSITDKESHRYYTSTSTLGHANNILSNYTYEDIHMKIVCASWQIQNESSGSKSPYNCDLKFSKQGYLGSESAFLNAA